MESKDTTTAVAPQSHRHNTKITNRSTSDADSQLDEFHTPGRDDSPLHSDYSKAIVSVTPKPPETFHLPPPPPMYYRSTADDAAKTVEEGVGGDRRSRAAVAAILKRPRRGVAVARAALGFRVCEVVLSCISFSVMASDKTQGWSGDSFYRYREYRYCLAVNIIAFAYSGFQAINILYHFMTGKNAISFPLLCHFDFTMDQILAYLLISSSSSSATRVNDWVLNWGNDEFTEMASASIGMSFLSFIAFALSSLISGYILCNRNSV